MEHIDDQGVKIEWEEKKVLGKIRFDQSYWTVDSTKYLIYGKIIFCGVT